MNIGDTYIRRTEHWVIERTITGVNGIGCPWVIEKWIWPNSGDTCRSNIRSLGYDETVDMVSPEPDRDFDAWRLKQ